MKAMVVREANGPFELDERNIPEPGPGEVRIKVEACGICGSDVMEWYRVPKAPRVLGHEATGIIEETGEKIEGDEKTT